MDFATDIWSLKSPLNKKLNLGDLPTNTDIYFRAKQKEIIDQYSAARVFMRESETDDWNHWFDPVEDQQHNEAFKLIFTSFFYESALIYYNIIVDLSWTICYVSAEFACTQKGKRVDFSGMKSIEDAAELLRKAENNVTNPTAEGNPFGYLKMMCPEFSNAIDLIINYWNTFGNSLIRNRYNFCKHKGKPSYSEIEELRGGRLMDIYFQNKDTNDKIQIASDIRDVQLQFSLIEAIDELRQFDDNELFPYINSLFKELEDVIKPSPMI